MSPKLAAIARKLNLQMPEKPSVPDSGLGSALEQLIQNAVQERVAAALEQREPPRKVRDLFNAPPPVTDYRQLPATPRTTIPRAMEFHFQRNEIGQINVVNAGLFQFRVERDGLGRIVRIIPADIAPVPPAIEPSELATARKYDPGEPR